MNQRSNQIKSMENFVPNAAALKKKEKNLYGHKIHPKNVF